LKGVLEMDKNAFKMTIAHFDGDEETSVIHLSGALNAASYQDLITEVKELCRSGVRQLVVDLRYTQEITISGLVALHISAMLLRGDEPPDPEAGWNAIHSLFRESEQRRQRNVRLVNTQPQVADLLERSGLSHYFPGYSRLETAVASC
jgi:anti-anti-sigma regulatory factor